MMTEDEWQDYRRKYLGQHNVYLADTPEIREAHSEGAGIDQEPENFQPSPLPEPDVPSLYISPTKAEIAMERPLSPAERMVRAMRERHQ